MLNLVLPLHASAWISVLATIFVIWLVGRFWAGLSSAKAFVDAVSTMLGASSGSLKTAPRLAVIGIRVGCFILAASYQSQLSSILTVPVLEQQIETPSQLIHTQHKLYKLCYDERILVDDHDPMKAQIDRRTDIIGRTRISHVLHDVMKGKAAVLGPQIALQHMVRDDPQLQPSVFVLDQVESFLPVAFLTRKGDPLVGQINGLIGRMKAAGLLLKWEKELLKGPEPKKKRPTVMKIKVTMSHLAGAFFLWLIGLAAAFMAFLFEVAV